jgi:hypothetical protein
MGASEIAERLGLPRETVRKRLDRWREKQADGWYEVTERKSRDCKYLYKIRDILPAIDDLLMGVGPASGEASSGRPSRSTTES